MALLYEKEGYVGENVGAVITLIIGVGIATMVLIFVGTLGGQTYSQVESDINGISDTTIQGYVKDSITSGFKALSQTGKQLPIIVLAIVMFVVLGLLTSLGGARRDYYGGAL